MKTLFVRVFVWFWLSTLALLLVSVIATALFSAFPPPPGPERLLQPVLQGFARLHGPATFDPGSVTILASSTDGFAFYRVPDAVPLHDLPESLREAVQQGRSAVGTSSLVLGSMTFDLFHDQATGTASAVYVFAAPRFLTFVEQASQARGFGAVLLVLLLGSGVICWLLSSNLAGPIEALREATTGFSEDLAPAPIPSALLARTDEIGSLARDFAKMQTRLSDLFESRNRFFAEVSHELRTPLTRIQLAIAMLEDGPAEERAALLQRIRQECAALDGLIGELLCLARLELNPDEHVAPFSVEELLRSLLENAAFEASDKALHFTFAGQPFPEVCVSRTLLSRALENIIRNAIRFAPAASEVKIDCREVRGAEHTRQVEIIVRDHGPGIPPDLLKRVKEPFFTYARADAQPGEKVGVGLGMALVDRIAAKLGGSLLIENALDGGLCVTLRLPV